MASIERTAYPRLGKRLSASELKTHYSITDVKARLTFLAMLKTRQHLGYFPALLEVPAQIVRFLADAFGLRQTIERVASTRNQGKNSKGT